MSLSHFVDQNGDIVYQNLLVYFDEHFSQEFIEVLQHLLVVSYVAPDVCENIRQQFIDVLFKLVFAMVELFKKSVNLREF